MKDKYEIITKDTDLFELKYKDKSFEFKTDLELKSRLESAAKEGRVKMAVEMTKQGIRPVDLTIEYKKDGKIYYDNSNKVELEKEYQQEAMLVIIDEICEKLFKNKLADLMVDMGLENAEEGQAFMIKLLECVMGTTPR